MEIPNVYELLNNKDYDPHSLRSNQFILQPHQVIPKYYLISNPGVNKLVLHYSLGSGKSSTAIFALLYNLDIYRMYKFNEQYSPKSSLFIQNNKINQNVIVIGAWQTKAQFELELMRPEFNVIDKKKSDEIKHLLNSPLEENRKAGEEKKRKIINQIDKDIKFQGYQAFFNSVFPDISSEAYNQNVDALIQEYNRGSLKISEDFLKKVRNNIIIVDEMQRLYSNLGLNTYGFAIACVSKIAKQYGIKIIFLSGTMINSSLGEVPDILSIISDEKKFYTKDEYCREDTILGDVKIWRLREDKYEETINMFKNNFMYYNQSIRLKNEIPEIVPIKKLPKSIYFPNKEDSNLKTIVFPRKKLLPEEIHVGNKIINDVDSLQPMILYSVQVQGFQAEKYKEYIKNNLNSINLNEYESDTTTYIHDAYIPDSSKWNEHRIYESNDVLWGAFLGLDKLRNYSALGYELCKLCINNGFNNEKTVVYHNKLNSFGIKQYGAILQYNGFIKYGSSPAQNSLCKFCQNTYKMHSLTLEERLKHKVCSKFMGMYYDMLTGDLDQNDRDSLTNNVFNNPNNLYGDIINVMFVSDVAYSGVSFFNTQNMVILSRIPNISKWKQIYARIIRTKSHALLPSEKQYAKIYTMIIELPDELKLFPQLGKYTFGERYYKVREVLNEDIEKYTKDLSEKCISKQLIESPEEYKPNKLEIKITSELFNSDMQNEINLIIRRIMINENTSIWTLKNLVERIKDRNLSVSFLNLSTMQTSIIENLLIKNKLITMFKFDRDETIYAQIYGKTYDNEAIDNLSTFKFTQLQNINLKKSNINNLMKLLEKEKSYTNKLILLAKILKLANKKYDLLANRKIFWDTMYEIGNEYYPDDETNFIHNHCRKNRNLSLFTGCYYGQEIILKDGTSKLINYSFPMVEGLKNLPFKFKITCLVLSESSPFYIHVNVIKISEKEINDKRRENKGLVCTSMNVSKLHEYFPNIDTKLHKKKYCNELLFEICEMQEKHKDSKFVYTPFEKG